jgi:hypothetical protein
MDSHGTPSEKHWCSIGIIVSSSPFESQHVVYIAYAGKIYRGNYSITANKTTLTVRAKECANSLVAAYDLRPVI